MHMLRMGRLLNIILAGSLILTAGNLVVAQHPARLSSDKSDFGPVMQAYLGYLRNEQEVVDDRASRREITGTYYRRNSNRIRALREMAIRLVRQTNNDYVPELEAVTQDEFGILFENPPRPTTFRASAILANKFRYLGIVHAGEVFYLFARLDPCEQATLIERRSSGAAIVEGTETGGAKGQRVDQSSTRPRRIVPR
jgi:hypothetical protein